MECDIVSAVPLHYSRRLIEVRVSRSISVDSHGRGSLLLPWWEQPLLMRFSLILR